MAVVTEEAVAGHLVSVSDRYSVMYATRRARNTYVLRRSKSWGVVASGRLSLVRDGETRAEVCHANV